jgi:hypothetical protein
MIFSLPMPFSIACKVSSSSIGPRVVSILKLSVYCFDLKTNFVTHLACAIEEKVLIEDVHWRRLEERTRSFDPNAGSLHFKTCSFNHRYPVALVASQGYISLVDMFPGGGMSRLFSLSGKRSGQRKNHPCFSEWNSG